MYKISSYASGNRPRIKAFKRILKELGVYHVWLSEREKVIHENGRRVFDCVGASFHSSIDGSFIWMETKFPKLWNSLYYSSRDEELKLSLSDFPYDAIKEIKEEMKHNMYG